MFTDNTFIVPTSIKGVSEAKFIIAASESFSSSSFARVACCRIYYANFCKTHIISVSVLVESKRREQDKSVVTFARRRAASLSSGSASMAAV